MCVLSIKWPIRKKSGNLSYATRTLRHKAYKETLKNENTNHVVLMVIRKFIIIRCIAR